MEIERKWLLEVDIPSTVTVVPVCTMHQAYMSVEPEVRIRLSDKGCKISAKSNDDLCREEADEEVGREFFDTCLRILGITLEDTIKKEYMRVYKGSHIIEVSHVDKGTENEFSYIEVEFDTIEKSKKLYCTRLVWKRSNI